MMNRLQFINLAFTQGYICFLPVVDEGIDLILYCENSRDLWPVQMKSR